LVLDVKKESQQTGGIRGLSLGQANPLPRLWNAW
jgi:hypothetical protein